MKKYKIKWQAIVDFEKEIETEQEDNDQIYEQAFSEAWENFYEIPHITSWEVLDSFVIDEKEEECED